MPRGDGTGPAWGGGPGSGRNAIRGGRGAGRMGGSRLGAGSSGDCICPKCGARVSHQIGTPCYALSCPKYGTKMIRG